MSESGWEALPDVREWSRDPPGCPGVVKRPSRMSGSGRESLTGVRQLLGVSPGYPGVVGRPSYMSGSCRETLMNVKEWLRGPPECRGVVGSFSGKIERSARRSGNGWDTLSNVSQGWEALPIVRKWSGGHLGCPGVFGRPSRMSGNGWEALPNVREWSGGPPECL